jgi:hypothetical protein
MPTLVPLAAVHQLNLEQMLRLVDTHTATAEGDEYEHGWLAARPGINTPDFVERVQLADPGPEPQTWTQTCREGAQWALTSRHRLLS